MLLSARDKRTAPARIATIGIGYNGSSRSIAALAVGRKLAALHGARIHAMEVVCPSRTLHDPRKADDPRMFAELGGRVDALLRQARQRLAGLQGVDGCAVYGIPVDELAAFGEEVDLLIVGLGSHHCGRRAPIDASTSAYLQRHARCPVLVVPRARPSCVLLEHRAPAAGGSWRSVRRARQCGP